MALASAGLSERVAADLGAEEAAVPQAVRALASVSRPPAKIESGTYSWSTGNYQYDASGNVMAIGDQSFRYDLNGRLTKAVIEGPDQARYETHVFTYDVYGNLQSRGYEGLSPTAISVNSATNHLSATSTTYDAAGNVSTFHPPDGSVYAFIFDALGMLKSESTGTTAKLYHVYTADDERYRTYDTTGCLIGSDCYVSGANVTKDTFTLRDLGGAVLRRAEKTPNAWRATHDYYYRDGLLLAGSQPYLNNRAEHFTLDHLGTPRLITDGSGAKIGFHAYAPFGIEWLPSGGPSAQEGEPKKFTGHERDRDIGADNSALDYMHARFYSASVGRFLSVDPVISKGAMQHPQGWNRYAYVRNNPLRHTDPTGKYTCTGSVDQCKAVDANVDRLRQAATILVADHAPGASALARAVSFYGKKGERNGVAVSVVDFNGAAVGSTERKNGLTIVSVDANALMASGSSRVTAVEMAATFAHEAEHGTRTGTANDPGNIRSEVKNDEREAFRWGGYVNAAFSTNSAYRVFENGAWDHAFLEAWAETATVADCQAMGGCK